MGGGGGGGVRTPWEITFLGKIFKIPWGGGGGGGPDPRPPPPPPPPPLPPYARRSAFSWVLLYCIRG